MATMILPPRYTLLDSNGSPISGGKVQVYDAGTTDARSIYTDAALSTAADNPVVADSAGVVPLRYTATGTFKLVFMDASDTVLLTVDDVDPGIPAGSGALAVANGGTGATAVAAARTNLGAASQTEVTSISSDVSQLQTDVTTVFTGDSGAGGAVGAVPAPAAGDTAEGRILGASAAWVQPKVAVAYYEQLSADISNISTTYSTPMISTDGTEVFEATFTPKDSGNAFIIDVLIYFEGGEGATAFGIFDGTTRLTSILLNQATADSAGGTYGMGRMYRHRYLPGTTSAQTLSIRLAHALPSTAAKTGSSVLVWETS